MKSGALIFSGIIFLTGCAHYRPQPLAPEKTAEQLESRSFADAGLEKFLEQNSCWQIIGGQKTGWDLNSLTLVAFYFHPGLAVARAQWRVAASGIETAGARPNPSVTFNPGYDSQIPGNYSPWLIPVTFDLPIETAGKRGKRLAEAQHAAESARFNFISAAWQIRSGVRSALLDYTMAGRRAALLAQQFSTQREIMKRLQQRFSAGDIARPELTVAQIALNQTQLALSNARADESNARSHLAEALGLPLAALAGQHLSFDFSTRDMTALTSRAARAVVLRSRADILASLADYATAEADLQLQVAKQYPDLHLGPGYAWNSGNAGDSQWSLGVTLELPILDQNQGPIAEAAARRQLAAAKFIELQSQVSAQIDRAVSDFGVAEEQLKISNELLTAQQQQQKSAQAQLAAGAAEPLEVLNAQLESVNTALTGLDNEAKVQSASGALEDALQCPADSLMAVIKKMAVEKTEAKE
jgi:cobalt-zinc-cadmium efflux system outer membrane protein